MNNFSLVKSDIDSVTLDSFKEAIYTAYKGGITSVAPLGFSGDTIFIFGGSRKCEVSIRNYGNDAELLITDPAGNFLFYGRYHISLGIDFVCDQYYNIFLLVKDRVTSEISDRPKFADLDIPDNCARTSGFAMLEAYQRQGGVLI